MAGMPVEWRFAFECAGRCDIGRLRASIDTDPFNSYFFLIAGGASWILKTFFRRLSDDGPGRLLDRHPGCFQPIVGAVHHSSIRDRPPFFLKAAKTTVVRPVLFRTVEL